MKCGLFEIYGANSTGPCPGLYIRGEEERKVKNVFYVSGLRSWMAISIIL